MKDNSAMQTIYERLVNKWTDVKVELIGDDVLEIKIKETGNLNMICGCYLETVCYFVKALEVGFYVAVDEDNTPFIRVY